jgi:hypothetical protein
MKKSPIPDLTRGYVIFYAISLALADESSVKMSFSFSSLSVLSAHNRKSNVFGILLFKKGVLIFITSCFGIYFAMMGEKKKKSLDVLKY